MAEFYYGKVTPVHRPDWERPGWTPEHPWVPGEGGPEGPGHGLPGEGVGQLPGHGLLPPLRPGHPWLPGLPGMPGHPGHLPGLIPEPPIALPPEGGIGQLPIFPESPEHPLPAPPGAVWPPLGGRVKGKVLLLAFAPGYGWRWVVVDAAAVVPMPKR